MAVMLLVSSTSDLEKGFAWGMCLARAFEQHLVLLIPDLPKEPAAEASEATLPRSGHLHQQWLAKYLAGAGFTLDSISCKGLRQRRHHYRSPAAVDDQVVTQVEVPSSLDQFAKEVPQGPSDLLVIINDVSAESTSVRTAKKVVFEAVECQAVLLNPGAKRRDAKDFACNDVMIPLTKGRPFATAKRFGLQVLGQPQHAVTRWARAASISAIVFETPEHQRPAGPARAAIHRARHQSRGLDLEELKQDIAQNANVDLLVMGEPTERSLRDHKQTGRKLLETAGDMAVALVRDPAKLANQTIAQTDGLIKSMVPQLDRQQRATLVQTLSAESTFGFEFAALIVAATLLAAIGLLQNSAAVIIGAMLVAPLMTPILGSGLSIIHGNVDLARRATKSVAIGFLMAYGVALLFGLLWNLVSEQQADFRAHQALRSDSISSTTDAPDEHGSGNAKPIWGELYRRSTTPSGFDFLIGLIGGAAATFARSRGGVSSALTGAVIAAALVPPIATAGIVHASALTNSFGYHDRYFFEYMTSPLLLFIVNVQTVILGTMICLYSIGIRSSHAHGTPKRWVPITFVAVALITLVLFVVVSV